MQQRRALCHTQFKQIDDIAHEETDVVEGIIQFMSDTCGELTQCGQFASLHKLFHMRPKVGLSTVLTGSSTAEETITPAPNLPGLFLLPAGPAPPHPAELLGSTLMKELIVQWRSQYDHVIIDSPPALSVTDAVLLSVDVDSVLLVIRSGNTTKAALRRSRELLAQVNARVMGTVVNAVDVNSPDYYHYYYYGSKYGGYGRYQEETAAKES